MELSTPIPAVSPANASAPNPLRDAILDRLRAARAVQIVGHVRPDGDCLGSMLAVHHLLDQFGVANAMAAEKMPTNSYDVLADFKLIQDRPDPTLRPDLIVYVDCATQDRGISDWTPEAPIINIDHHGSNTRYGEINWIAPECAATGEMLYELAEQSGTPITPAMAEAMLIALTTDTGSFRFSNTGPRQHIVAARLIEAGASAERVSRIAFSSHPAECVRLTGHVLSTMHVECGGRLIWSEIRRGDFERFGGEANAAENLADSLRSIRGSQLSMLFHDLPKGGLRLNLRSDGAINVAKLAANWSGGGHPCAAGLFLPDADYEKERDMILDTVRKLLA